MSDRSPWRELVEESSGLTGTTFLQASSSNSSSSSSSSSHSSVAEELFPSEDQSTIPTLTPEQTAVLTELQLRFKRIHATRPAAMSSTGTTPTGAGTTPTGTTPIVRNLSTIGGGTALAGDLTVKVGGFTCVIEAAKTNQAATITQENGCLYPVTERPDPHEKEFRKITEYCQKVHFEPKFSRSAACLNDIKSLTNVNDLRNQIDQLKSVLEIIDLKQIFSALFPINMAENAELKKDTKGDVISVDLLTNHGTLTAKQVGESSMHWKKFLFYLDKGKNERTFQNEHSQTFHLVQNHMEANLRDAVVRQYNTYNKEWHGGPLLLWTMMQHLMAGNETAMQTLIITVGKYNISTDAKDDVRYAISVL